MENNKELLRKFGETLQKLRKERGLSQEELAHRSGVHRTYIGMLERAERNVTLINLKKIADGLNIEIKQFFE